MSNGQLCIEERLGSQFDLYQYRQEKGSRLDTSEWEDRCFLIIGEISQENCRNRINMLTDIY